MTDLNNGSYLNTITALAVSPDDTKLACHGWRSKQDNIDNWIGYVFMLRTDTGASASGLIKMTHHSNRTFHVNSAGFLLYDSGILMMAFDVNGNYNAGTASQRFYLGAVDLTNKTVQWSKTSETWHGSSSALVRPNSSTFSDVYAAGSY